MGAAIPRSLVVAFRAFVALGCNGHPPSASRSTAEAVVRPIRLDAGPADTTVPLVSEPP